MRALECVDHVVAQHAAERREQCGKARRGGACARLFELHIAGEQAVQVHCVVRAAEAVRKGCFAGADDIPAERAGGGAHEVFEGGAQLFFRFAVRDLGQFVGHGGSELLQGCVNCGGRVHGVGGISGWSVLCQSMGIISQGG